jgi:hypothetical protein
MSDCVEAGGDERLWIAFMRMKPFHSDPVRCFLEYLRRQDGLCRIVNLPENLYQVSSKLVADRGILEGDLMLELPGGDRHEVEVGLIETECLWTSLTLSARDREVIRLLTGMRASNDLAIWAKEILGAGGRMMAADCAQVNFEPRSNETARLRLEEERLTFSQLPLMSWIAPHLAHHIVIDESLVKAGDEQWDGALLLSRI